MLERLRAVWGTLMRRRRVASLVLAGHIIFPTYNLVAEVHDAATGALLQRSEQHNLVTTAGCNLIRDFINGDAPAGLGWFGVGTGTTPAAITDTALQAEVAASRGAFAGTTKTAGTLTVSYYLNSGTANGNTLTEVGLFNASSSGTMYARALLANSIVKTSSVTVTFTWILTWS